MDILFSAESWAALLTLTVLEIVLGIDNIVFISILAGKLPAEKRARARTLGLGLAMGTNTMVAAIGLVAGHGHADTSAAFAGVDHAADTAVAHHRIAGNLRTRHDSVGGRRVSLVEEHHGDP